MFRRWLRLLSFSALLLSPACVQESPLQDRPDRLTIAAASSLRPAVDSMIEIWNREHPSIPARASYGASGVLYAQIGAEAPFDLFLSADDVYPRRVHENGRGDEPFQFAVGRLAVWTPETIDPVLELGDLTRPRFEKIAVASPNLAPYGEAALEALEGAGIYDGIKSRLLFAGNVMEAAHFAESGGAEAALIPVSLVVSTGLGERGNHYLVPERLHDPVVHEGTILAGRKNREAAGLFVELLLGPEGRSVLETTGFSSERTER
ncbi:MAG: molybdate ABC transporter substrate-binding protein [Thermoanaerobaculia bacterium]|nr:molybdate ABC transporter substrate-binding protein [Thermoanaerobaculia bacterium]